MARSKIVQFCNVARQCQVALHRVSTYLYSHQKNRRNLFFHSLANRKTRREGLGKNGLVLKTRRQLDEDCKGTDNVRPDLSSEVQPVSLRDTWRSLPEISVKSS